MPIPRSRSAASCNLHALLIILSRKRNIIDSKMSKMVLDIDLNDLPAESWQFEDIDFQHEQISIIGSSGSFTSPIDADAIDDDVILLPSSAWHSMAKSQSRTKRPVTVVIDESLQKNARQSVLVEEPGTTLSLGIQKFRTQIPLGRTIIDCDLNANESCIPKMNKGRKPNLVAWKEALEPLNEPFLKCPLCLSSLNEPSTTVCGHLFCRICIEIAISKQKKCPTCRRKLTKRNVHRIFP